MRAPSTTFESPYVCALCGAKYVQEEFADACFVGCERRIAKNIRESAEKATDEAWEKNR